MTDWLIAAIAAIPGTAGGIFAMVSATRTARIGAQTTRDVAAQNAAVEHAKVQVDQARLHGEAVKQLQEMYEQLLAEHRTELERLHASVERLQANADTLGERLVARTEETQELRAQLYELQEQLREHKALIQHQERLGIVREQQIEMLKTRLRAAGLPPDEPEEA